MPHLIVATFLVQVVKILFGPILIYDILSAILFTIITCIFYKIFNSSISVIKDSKTKKAFAIEELIGTSLLIAIAIAAFREISIFGNDMAGDSPDSWVCQFKEAGFEVCPVLKGLGEYPGIRAMFVEHAREAIASM